MKENLFNSAHKATNDRYRNNYDATFGEFCSKCRNQGDECECLNRSCWYLKFDNIKKDK